MCHVWRHLFSPQNWEGMGSVVNLRRPFLRHLFDLPIPYVTSSKNQTKALSRISRLFSVEAFSLAYSCLYLMGMK